MPSTVKSIVLKDKNGAVVYPVTDVALISGLGEGVMLGAIMSYDGTAEPVVANIPAGVQVEWESEPSVVGVYTGTLQPSANTVGKVYYVLEGVSLGVQRYGRYLTTGVSGSYQWSYLGNTDLQSVEIVDTLQSIDATKALSARQGRTLNLTKPSYEVAGTTPAANPLTQASKEYVQSLLLQYYTKEQVDVIMQAVSFPTFIIAWDGTAEPVVANIPAGVVVNYNTTDYIGTLAASNSTAGHIYLVKNGVTYDMYVTVQGSTYAWAFIGTTAVNLTIVNNLTTNDATQALSAAMGVELAGQVSQLEHEVHNMSNKFYGVFLSAADLPNDVTEPGYAYVGSSSPFTIYNFDGNTWTDSETTMDSMYGPSVNPFKGFFNSVADLNAAYPTPMTGQYAYVNQGGTPAVAHIYFSNGGVWSDSGVSVSGDQESDFTRFAKSLLIQTLSKVAWTDANAQAYLSALEDALINDIVVDHITAVFEPGSALITENTTLDELRQYLTVTVFYNNGTSEIVTTYTLAGTMSAGTQTITVDYLGTTDTFTVNVLGNYAESIDNWMYHPNNSVAQYDSRGYIALKCSNATDLNNYNCYVADIKKTLWSAVNGKTIKVRIKTNSTTDGLFGLGIYKNSSITSIPAENARRAGLSNLVLADDGYYEQTFVCDISNFTIGSLTPETSATFGVWCYSRSTSVWSQIFDVQIFDVTP